MKQSIKVVVVSLLILPALAGAQDSVSPPPPAATTVAPPDNSQPALTPPATPADVANPAPAGTQTLTAAQRNDPVALAQKSFTFSFELDHSIGSGTFVNSRNWSSVVGTLLVTPAYAFNAGPVRLRASLARIGGSYEYTVPDTDNGRRFSVTDIPFALSAPGLIRIAPLNITMNPDVRVTAPLSFESRFAGLIAATGVGVTSFGSYFDGSLQLAHRVSFNKNWHSSQVPLQSPQRLGVDAQGIPLSLCRGGEQSCAGGTASSSFSVANSLSASYNASDALSFGLAFSLSNGFRYPVALEGDQFTSKAVDSNGNLAAKTGHGRTDRLTGSASVSYQFDPRLSLSLGVGRDGLPKTPDNRNFRNPLFDTTASADNTTSYSLTLSGLY